jgi:diadenylate cyclase
VNELSHRLLEHANALAREIGARALVIYADALEGESDVREVLSSVSCATILFTRAREPPALSLVGVSTWIRVEGVHTTRKGQARLALLICVARGVLRRGDRVVCLTGPDGSNRIDTAMVLDLGTEPGLFATMGELDLGGDYSAEVFERVLWIASRIATEGREGRPIGTIFVLGDSAQVLAQSRQLVLNPLQGHPESGRSILSLELEETLKEFATIDGAFVVRGDGVVLAAGVQLQARPSKPLDLPAGLGTRHAAAAAITGATSAVAFAISQSTRTVTVFKSGGILTQIQHSAGHSDRPESGWAGSVHS